MSATFLPSALLRHGFTNLVSVIPPGAQLQPTSTILPAMVGKIPGRKGANGLWAGYDWRKAAVPTPEEVAQWSRDGASVGLRADHFPAVDIDVLDEALAQIIEDVALQTLGAAPERTGRPPKRLLMYRTNVPFSKMQLHITKGDQRSLVEVLGKGQQYLVFGTHPVTLRPYTWDRDMTGVSPNALTVITQEQVAAFLVSLESVLETISAGIMKRVGDGRNADRSLMTQQPGLRAPSMAVLSEGVRAIPNTSALFPTREDYIKVGYAIRGASGDDLDDGYAVFAEWAARWEGNERGGNDPDVVLQDWRRMHPPYAVGWNYLAELARQHGFDDAGHDFSALSSSPTDATPPAVLYSDQWLAERVCERQRAVLRFVPQRDTYLVWTGARWQPDQTLLAEDVVKKELRRIADMAARVGGSPAAQKQSVVTAFSISSAARFGAVLRFVRSDRSLAIDILALDHDPMLLNTPGGIVDLTTGTLLPPDPDALCTKSTAVKPEAGACPRWLAFLDETTQGDPPFAGYLQRLCGYALTGSTREQHLTFIHGPGGNGKSVFLNTLIGLLGDYAVVASMDLFTATDSDKHTTDIAMLNGARLVAASESQAGKRWNEARVKSFTGGEPITARFMRQDNFTFWPKFKLVFVGNHKPEIRDVDAAMKRRIHMAPFTVTPRETDPELPAKLRLEWPAILQWMVEGCLAWQHMGLAPPEKVRVSSEEYFAGEDAVARWLDECVQRDAAAITGTQELFANWRQWAGENGEHVGSLKRLSTKLETKGFVKSRIRNDNGRAVRFVGLTLPHPLGVLP